MLREERRFVYIIRSSMVTCLWRRRSRCRYDSVATRILHRTCECSRPGTRARRARECPIAVCSALLMRPAHRQWSAWAMKRINADFCRSSDTHLLPVRLSAFPGIQLYLKDESTHVTGSLKHRLARSLFLYALVNGQLREGSLVVEASSGSTAISEAYFAVCSGCRSWRWYPRRSRRRRSR